MRGNKKPRDNWAPEELGENGRALFAKPRGHFAGIRNVPVAAEHHRRGTVNAQQRCTAPAVERVVLRWLTEMVGHPAGVDGVLVNGALLATTYAVVAADPATGWSW